MPTQTPQREFATQVVRQLRDVGYKTLWAGGCVRDELLGRAPNDFDVATSARPEQVRDLFGHKRTLAIGAAFGVISILGGRDKNNNRLDPIEVATFRSDGAYIDGRHPTEVTFTTAEEDAQRRDFTINGLFYDPIDKNLIAGFATRPRPCHRRPGGSLCRRQATHVASRSVRHDFWVRH